MKRHGWIAAVLGLSLAGAAHAQQMDEQQGTHTEQAKPEPQQTDTQALKRQLETDKKQPQAAERRSAMEAQGFEMSSLDEEQVKGVQRDLQAAGYYRGEIDGIPGGATRQAVSRFYRDQAQLGSRGVILPGTAGSLGIHAAEVERVSGEDRTDDAQRMPSQPPSGLQQPAYNESMQYDRSTMRRDESVHAPPVTKPSP